MLTEYTVEHKKDGWYFGRSARFGEKEELRGPYSTISSVTLVIARHLSREIAKRDASYSTDKPSPEAANAGETTSIDPA